MNPLPVLEPRQVIALLQKRGFVLVRRRGAHQMYRSADGQRLTVVPDQDGRDIAIPLLRQIARDVGVTPEAFVNS